MKPATPFVLTASLALAAVLGLASTPSRAAAPESLHFQGRVSVNGIPFTGSGLFRFALLDGTDVVAWSSAPDTNPADGQPDTPVPLPVTKGLYTVPLGVGMLPIPANLFSTHDQLRLRVWFDDGTHGPELLSPDQPLAAVPYARQSASAEFAVSAASAATAQAAATITGTVPAAQVTGTIPISQLPNTVALLDSPPTFTGTVRAPAFQGAGAIPWILTASADVIATPNTGYLSDLEPGNGIVVTLPSQAQPGDVVRVAAAGAGSWYVQGSPGDQVLGADPGKYWNSSGPALAWRSIAMSANGRRLIAAAHNAPLFLSSDAGQTWTPRLSPNSWTAVASSQDGSLLAAAVVEGPIWVSSDRGTNWLPRAMAGAESYVKPNVWTSVAASATGRRLIAAAGIPSLWISNDSGTNWTETYVGPYLDAVALSADGEILIAAGESSVVVSTDSGQTWNETWLEWADSLSSIALSADGTRAVTGDSLGSLWFTEDTGRNWRGIGNNLRCRSIALSADGTRVIVAQDNGTILYSRDFGFTWDEWPATGPWTGVACSAEGLFFALVGEDFEIATSAGILSGNPGSMAEFVHLGGGRWRGFPFAMTPPLSGRFVMDPPEFPFRTPARPVIRNSRPLPAPAGAPSRIYP